MVRPLTEHDFTGSDPCPASRIRIVTTLSGFSSEDPGDHDDWFQSGRGVPKWCDEQGREQPQPGPNLKLCVNVGFCARFDRDELDIMSIRYFHDDDDAMDPFDDDGGLAQIPARLITEIGLFVLPAKRDWCSAANYGGIVVPQRW
jgi:putative ATP-dependent endonuclease of the OLD family